MSTTARRERFLGALLALGGELFDLLEQSADRDPTHPEVATGKSNPYGSKTLFLQAASRGDFPTFQVGRAIGALWPDVLAGMKAQPIKAQCRKKPTAPASVLSAPVDLDAARRDRHRRMTEPRPVRGPKKDAAA